jgi:hypothetical protein
MIDTKDGNLSINSNFAHMFKILPEIFINLISSLANAKLIRFRRDVFYFTALRQVNELLIVKKKLLERNQNDSSKFFNNLKSFLRPSILL